MGARVPQGWLGARSVCVGLGDSSVGRGVCLLGGDGRFLRPLVSSPVVQSSDAFLRRTVVARSVGSALRLRRIQCLFCLEDGSSCRQFLPPWLCPLAVRSAGVSVCFAFFEAVAHSGGRWPPLRPAAPQLEPAPLGPVVFRRDSSASLTSAPRRPFRCGAGSSQADSIGGCFHPACFTVAFIWCSFWSCVEVVCEGGSAGPAIAGPSRRPLLRGSASLRRSPSASVRRGVRRVDRRTAARGQVGGRVSGLSAACSVGAGVCPSRRIGCWRGVGEPVDRSSDRSSARACAAAFSVCCGIEGAPRERALGRRDPPPAPRLRGARRFLRGWVHRRRSCGRRVCWTRSDMGHGCREKVAGLGLEPSALRSRVLRSNH